MELLTCTILGGQRASKQLLQQTRKSARMTTKHAIFRGNREKRFPLERSVTGSDEMNAMTQKTERGAGTRVWKRKTKRRNSGT